MMSLRPEMAGSAQIVLDLEAIIPSAEVMRRPIHSADARLEDDDTLTSRTATTRATELARAGLWSPGPAAARWRYAAGSPAGADPLITARSHLSITGP